MSFGSKSNILSLKSRIRKGLGTRSSNSPGPRAFKALAWGIVTSRTDEIFCDECFGQLARFVDMTLAARDSAQALPLVRDHLDRCADCREEYEAILRSLGAVV